MQPRLQHILSEVFDILLCLKYYNTIFSRLRKAPQANIVCIGCPSSHIIIAQPSQDAFMLLPQQRPRNHEADERD